MKKNIFTSNQIKLINSHSRYMTRRQFVGLGLASATSTALVPNLNLFTAGNAIANIDTSFKIPFLAFDLAGGAGLPGSFLVGGKGGPLDLLPSYSTLGWNPRTDGWDERFGLPMAKPSISKLSQGLLETMGLETQKNFRMGSLNHVTRDDTSDNPLSILELLSSLEGMAGSKTSKPIGTSTNPSGGNSRGLKSFSKYSAIQVRRIDDLTDLASIGGQLDKLDPKIIQKSLEFMKRLSLGQSRQRLSEEQVNSVLSSYEGIAPLVGGAKALDPRQYDDVRTIYGLTENVSTSGSEAIRSSIVHNVLNGTTGPGVITIGGCDYHDSTQATGDNKDLEIGREIGRAVELAHQRKKPLFIHIYSDGGVAAIKGSRIWQSDNGEKSMSVIGYYHPDGAPAFRSSSSVQVGHYTSGEGVERDTLIGGSPSNASFAVFANYMNVIGRFGDVEKFIPPFSRDQLESILVYS